MPSRNVVSAYLLSVLCLSSALLCELSPAFAEQEPAKFLAEIHASVNGDMLWDGYPIQTRHDDQTTSSSVWSKSWAEDPRAGSVSGSLSVLDSGVACRFQQEASVHLNTQGDIPIWQGTGTFTELKVFAREDITSPLTVIEEGTAEASVSVTGGAKGSSVASQLEPASVTAEENS